MDTPLILMQEGKTSIIMHESWSKIWYSRNIEEEEVDIIWARWYHFNF